MPKAKVLIVNDDAYGAMEMQQLLTLVDFDVVGVAASVNDALCLAENTHPDLAIFDVRLAGRRDGIEGAAILRDRCCSSRSSRGACCSETHPRSDLGS